jgi:uncharacterized protein involved in exopolysaccharide biosynthesis
MYLEVLQSTTLLEKIAQDTFTVAEQQGRRAPLVDLLGIEGGSQAVRLDRAVDRLRKIVQTESQNSIGSVTVTTTTRWPSLSEALADTLIRAVNTFNMETRQSQATAERRFVEAQAADAERELRAAEDRTTDFLQKNRNIDDSPQLTFQLARLQRQVALNQQNYTSLVQNLEDAKIREVRNTPVISMIEDPRLPVRPESRGVLVLAVAGAAFGAVIVVLLALVWDGLARARDARGRDAEEFFELLQGAAPRLAKRVRS